MLCDIGAMIRSSFSGILLRGKKFAIALLLLGISYHGYAQSGASSPAETGYVIHDIQNNIEKWFFGGNTKTSALYGFLGIWKGKYYPTQELLEQDVHDWQTRVQGAKIFKSGGDVSYALTGSLDEKGRKQVVISVSAKEGLNLIALPYPQYSSNTGLDIGVRMRDYNFLGSTSAAAFDMDYYQNQKGINGFSAQGAATLPLFFGNRLWSLSINAVGRVAQDGRYYELFDKSYTVFNAGAKLSTLWALGDTRFSADTYVTQNIYVSQTGPQYDQYDPYYFATTVGGSLDLPLFNLPWVGWLTLTPAISATVNYRFDKMTQDSRTGLFSTGSVAVGMGRVDWVGLFRQGFTASATAGISYDPYKARRWGAWGQRRTGPDQWALPPTYSATMTGFYPLSDYFAVYGRAGWIYNQNNDAEDVDFGYYLRGIRDSRMRGDMLFYWNSDLLMKAWIWRLDALGDVLGSIFYDGGLTRRYQGGWNRPFHASGLEIQIIPQFARSLTFRASIGFDMNDVASDLNLRGSSPRDGANRWELSLGLGTFY